MMMNAMIEATLPIASATMKRAASAAGAALGLLMTAAAHAESTHILSHYADVLEAVSHGGSVQAVSTLHNCIPAADDAIKLGSAPFAQFMVYPVEKGGQQLEAVASSTTKLINKRGAGFVLEHIRLRILSDDTAEFSEQYLNPANYAVIQTGPSYVCRLNTDQDSSGGLTLYGRHGGQRAEHDADAKSGQ